MTNTVKTEKGGSNIFTLTNLMLIEVCARVSSSFSSGEGWKTRRTLLEEEEN